MNHETLKGESKFLLSGLHSWEYEEKVSLIYEEGSISWIGESEKEPVFDGAKFDFSEHIITPGLCNAHTHLAMTPFRDIAHSQSQMIEKLFFPVESQLRREWIQGLCGPSILEAMWSGTTTFFEHYYFSSEFALLLDKLGLRGMVGGHLADTGGAFPGEGKIEKAIAEIDSWPHSDRVKPILCPHAANTMSEASLSEIAKLSADRELKVHTHLSQNAFERLEVEKEHGLSPVDLFEKHGLLTDRLLAVHLVTADIKDLEKLKSNGVKVGLSPSSQILYENLAPIEDFWGLGLEMLLGTDCSASNDGFHLREELRTLSLLFKDRGCKVETQSLLDTVTTNPFEFYGDPNLARLSVGSTDFVIWPIEITQRPIQDIKSNFIFSSHMTKAKHTMVEGDWVLFDSEPVKISVTELTKSFEDSFLAFKKDYKPPQPNLIFPKERV